MDIAYEVGKYLADGGFGTLGTDIFIDQIPSDKNGIYVSIIGGSMNKYLPIEEAALDIYVKDSSATDAVTTLSSINKRIHRMHNTITANSYIYSILAIGNIESLDRDLEYTKLFKITYSVKFRYTSLIS
jgi:hypothetical protein